LLPTLPGHIPPGNRGKPVTPPTLSLSQLDARIGRYLVDTYHHRVHPETGQPPVRRWLAGGWLPRMPETVQALDLLLLTVATPRKVHRDGIRCHGLRYLALTLAAYVGEEVTIRYDPRDLAEIRVFHHGTFLCVAVSPELAAASISLKDLEAARNRRRRQLRQELTSRRSLVDELTHPVREPVPTEAATIERTPDLAPADPPRPSATRLKIYRED
jgi:putative transposase